MILFGFISLSILGKYFSASETTLLDNSSSVMPQMGSLPPLGRPMRDEFLMDPNFIQLNHGSYGTYPKSVQRALHEAQLRAERNGEMWMRRDLKIELKKVRQLLAKYMNAEDAEDLVVIPNTTSGMNAIFRSLLFNRGDKILHFNTVYEAMRSVVQHTVDTSQGNVTKVQFNVSYPISNEDLVQNFKDFLNANHNVDSPIRIALIDHITSVPGVVNPIEEYIPLLKEKNILVLIDGAHAIGQVNIDLQELDVDFYITNCHKWLYAVRGSAVMFVNKRHQPLIHPSSISSFYSTPSDFQNEFFWTGTIDYSQYMTIPAAIEFRNKIGEDILRNYTHNLAINGGILVARILGTRVLQDENQIGNMVDVELPILNPDNETIQNPDYWIDTLINRFNLYVAAHKHNNKIWIRMSAQIYNDLSDFQKVGDVFTIICNEVNQKQRLNSNQII